MTRTKFRNVMKKGKAKVVGRQTFSASITDISTSWSLTQKQVDRFIEKVEKEKKSYLSDYVAQLIKKDLKGD